MTITMPLEVSQDASTFDARAMVDEVAVDMQAAFQLWTDSGEGVRLSAVLRTSRIWPRPQADGRSSKLAPALLAAVVGLLVGISIGAAVGSPHELFPLTRHPFVGPRRSLAGAVKPAATLPKMNLTHIGKKGPTSFYTEAAPAVPTISRTGDKPAARFLAPPKINSPLQPDQIRQRPLARGAQQSTKNVSHYATDLPEVLRIAPRTLATTPRLGSICAGEAGFDRRTCLVRASYEADEELRRTYQEAVETGVPNEVLRRYTRSWGGLRQMGGSQSERMVLGYQRLSVALRADAERAEREHGDPPADRREQSPLSW